MNSLRGKEKIIESYTVNFDKEICGENKLYKLSLASKLLLQLFFCHLYAPLSFHLLSVD